MSKTTVEIEKEIESIDQKKDELKKELTKAKFNESKTLLWNDKMSLDEKSEKIGFHCISKGKILLQALYDSKKLYLEHEGVGNHVVYMNPQKNRYIVYRVNINGTTEKIGGPEDSLLYEDKVDAFLFQRPGTWYEITEDFLKYIR